jgi:CBS domain-containing protein
MKPSQIKARDIMNGRFNVVHPESSLREALTVLSEQDAAALVVVNNAGRHVGFISMTEIIAHEIARVYDIKGLDSSFTETDEVAPLRDMDSAQELEDILAGGHVGSVMRTEMVVVSPDTPVTRLARAMSLRKTHFAAVARTGRPVGILSSMDILKALGRLSP